MQRTGTSSYFVLCGLHDRITRIIDSAEYFWDPLSREEADFARAIIEQLKDEQWAKPLITSINQSGGVDDANKAKLFELRFGYALHCANITPQYEIHGEGGSKLDYGFESGGRYFRVELMRLELTDAARKATHTATNAVGIEQSSRFLSPNNVDQRQTVEGEMLKSVERICQKCERNGKPYKFPLLDKSIHVLLVDSRTVFNECDAVQIALGGEFVKEPLARCSWNGTLISGVFSPNTKLRGAAQMRERVHYIVFVNEKNYAPNEIPKSRSKLFAKPPTNSSDA